MKTKIRTCEGCKQEFLAKLKGGIQWQQYCNAACYRSHKLHLELKGKK
jgi:hypothetical protein